MKAIMGKEKLIHSPFISEYDYLKMNDLLPREEVYYERRYDIL